MKLEAAEAARRDERRRTEDAAAGAADAARAREASMVEEHKRCVDLWLSQLTLSHTFACCL